MLDDAKKILKRYIGQNEKVAIAISGGMDSMCLFFLVLESDIVKKENICVFNVNHGIRGELSDNDSRFVREQAKKAGIDFIGEVVDVPTLSKISGKSIETEAREQRRRLFNKLIEQKKATKILLAHHMDDQAETVLMHIFRGSGLAGLSGMKILSGNILRPLLTTAKSQIEKYVTTNSIPFVTDETNLINDYNRNYLRNEIIPQIEKKWRGVNVALMHLAFAAEESRRLIDSLIDKNLIYSNQTDNGIISLSIKCFEYDKPTSHYIFCVLEQINVHNDIEYKHIELIKELSKARNGARINLTGGIMVAKEYDRITFYHENKVEIKEHTFGLGVFSFGKKTIAVKKAKAVLEKGELIFDYDKVPKNSVIRMRQDGDIFKAVGGGTKKLKKVLIDKKIPLRLRNEIPCLASGNKILLIFGVEVSESIKIDDTTINAAKAIIEESDY